MARSTRAIVMRAFGGPEVLRAEALPLPGALGAALGARVVAVVRASAPEAYLQGLGAARIVTSAAELGARTADAVLNSVVGALFEPLLTALADGGRYCMVGAMGGDRVAFSAWELLRGIAIATRSPAVRHSSTTVPEPPISAGKSFCLGSPSLILRTASP